MNHYKLSGHDDTIRILREKGLSVAKIAKLLKVNRTTVFTYMKRHMGYVVDEEVSEQRRKCGAHPRQPLPEKFYEFYRRYKARELSGLDAARDSVGLIRNFIPWPGDLTVKTQQSRCAMIENPEYRARMRRKLELGYNHLSVNFGLEALDMIERLEQEAGWLAAHMKCDNAFTPEREAACIREHGPCANCLREAARRAVVAQDKG